MKINGKKFKVKDYRELTLREYEDIIKLMQENRNFTVFNYIAYLSGLKFDEFKLKKVTGLEGLQERLGQLRLIVGEAKINVPTIEGSPLKKYVVFDGRLYGFDNVDMKSKVGYRIAIEQYLSKQPNFLDLYTFTFATVLHEKEHKNFDYEGILKLQSRLKDYKAYDILGNGAFFFFNLMSGEKSVLKYLIRLKTILTKIIVQPFRREYTI